MQFQIKKTLGWKNVSSEYEAKIEKEGRVVFTIEEWWEYKKKEVEKHNQLIKKVEIKERNINIKERSFILEKEEIKALLTKEKSEKEVILNTLKKVRKNKNLKPQETLKEVLLKAEYLAIKEKHLEHWIIPIPPEPELIKQAWEWIKLKKWEKYTEKIYFQLGTGWVAVIHTKW